MSQKSGPGWVRGTGRRDCPVGYPVKGNEPSNVYYEPGDPGYPQVIPEMCFEDAAVAVKVGFTHVKGGDAVEAAVPAGFLRATGGRECPAGYPIKGNEPSNVFYRPEDPGYAQVIPEVCFADVSEAEKAGFTRVKHEAAKKTEPVAAVRKEEVAAAGVAAAGVAAAKAADVKADAPKAAEAARVAAPPPPPPPPPPPAPVAEASGGGWMKWLLPLLALAALAAGIWYFTRDDDEDEPTPTVAATVAATIAAGAEGTVEAIATEVGEADATIEAAGGTPGSAVDDIEGTVEADVAAAEGSAVVAATDVAGTVEASGIEGTVEADVAAVEGTVEAGVGAASGTVEAVETSAAGTVEAGVGAVETGVAEGEATVEAALATGVASPEASPVASPVAGAGIHLIAKDIAFDPTAITIQASDLPVTITMENTGAAEHDFVIDALDISVHTNPGESVEIVIPAGTAAGEYQYYCSIPGHKEAGMVGTLTVQ